MRGVQILKEIEEFSNLLKQAAPHWVVVDHYGLNVQWERIVREMGIKLMVIDDILRDHECDALLDQNLHAPAELEKCQYGKINLKFFGPEFAILSPSFLKLSPPLYHTGLVTNVLAFFGGSDQRGETLRFIRLIPAQLKHLKFKIVVGQGNPFKNEILAQAIKFNNTSVQVQTRDMASLMMGSDLYIGTGGTITWERCFLGVPGLCLSIADNQVEIAKTLHKMGVHEYIGDSLTVSDDFYIERVKNLILDRDKIRQFHAISLKLGVSSKIHKLFDVFV